MEIEAERLPTRQTELCGEPGFAKKAWDAIVFSPLAQGLLTFKYLNGFPSDSRAARDSSLRRADVNEKRVAVIRALNGFANQRGRGVSHGSSVGVTGRAREECIGSSNRVTQVGDNVDA